MATGAGIGGLFGPIAGGAGGYGLANMAMGSAPREREERHGEAANRPPFFGMRRLLG
jgi:hypothetical protein